jgi:RNA polymerase sigma-70 factor (ECF subfamily)
MVFAQDVGRTMSRELVIRAQEGDHDAFARLANSSISRLNAVARLILHDGTLVEDAVQDALIEAWRDLRALRDPDRFDAWLNRLLVRACQDAWRRRSRRALVELPLRPIDDAPIADAQAAVADVDELERGLRRLTLDQRAAVVLAYYLDLPLADVAVATGVPVGTVKSRLNRSMSALRASIEADSRQSSIASGRLA